ncbi:MAG: hypothetical protein Tsb0015_01740 [Simkaniaceae bacterium]
MLELSPFRKNKINLEDYDYQKDIQNRILMSRLSSTDIEVLEEILYSPLTIPISKLAKNLDLSETRLKEILSNLEKTELFHLENDHICVDKEMRKYYEHQMVKFESNFFIPNLDFLQNLLKKVPIHVLPSWYHIPRTTNNIFDSLVEKYLMTPQIFHRYLKELNLGDQILTNIVEDVFCSPELKVPSETLQKKYGLSMEKFEECMLHLEFNFVCCLGYEKKENGWQEFVTPFQEWRDYLLFLRNTTPKPIEDVDGIQWFRPHEFGFIEDLNQIMLQMSETPKTKESFADIFPKYYLDRLFQKLQQLHLVEEDNNSFFITSAGLEWIKLSIEDKALFIYRHPSNQMISEEYAHLASEKNIREIEKSIGRIIDLEWVYFEDFMKGVLIPLSEKTSVSLKKIGRRWKYTLPEYSQDELNLIRTTILDGLFESGMIIKGMHNDKECFKITSLGKSLFV